MSRITREQVERTAHLARLRLEPEEAEAMTRSLEAILDYAAQLEALDTEGVEPTAHVIPLATPLRPDEPHDTVAPERAVVGAPAFEGTAFTVPKVLDSEAEG